MYKFYMGDPQNPPKYFNLFLPTFSVNFKKFERTPADISASKTLEVKSL